LKEVKIEEKKRGCKETRLNQRSYRVGQQQQQEDQNSKNQENGQQQQQEGQNSKNEENGQQQQQHQEMSSPAEENLYNEELHG